MPAPAACDAATMTAHTRSSDAAPGYGQPSPAGYQTTGPKSPSRLRHSLGPSTFDMASMFQRCDTVWHLTAHTLPRSFELHGAAALGAPRHVITENLAPQYLYWIGRNQHGNIIPISSGEFEQRYVLAD
jgi:hypothetical protein